MLHNSETRMPKLNYHFWKNFWQLLFMHETGIRSAVRYGNYKAVNLLLDYDQWGIAIQNTPAIQNQVRPCLRHLIKLALDQWKVSRGHIAGADAVQKTIYLVCAAQDKEYRQTKKQATCGDRIHAASLSQRLSRVYYAAYGEYEQKYYCRAIRHQYEKHWYEYRPLSIEFDHWIHLRCSVPVVSFIFTWCLLAPHLVCIAIVRQDPDAATYERDMIWLIITSVMVSFFATMLIMNLIFKQLNALVFWPQVISIASIYLGAYLSSGVPSQFPSEGAPDWTEEVKKQMRKATKKVKILQSWLLSFVVVISALLNYVVFNLNIKNYYSVPEWEDEEPDPPLSPKATAALNGAVQTTNLLVAWITLAHLYVTCAASLLESPRLTSYLVYSRSL